MFMYAESGLLDFKKHRLPKDKILSVGVRRFFIIVDDIHPGLSLQELYVLPFAIGEYSIVNCHALMASPFLPFFHAGSRACLQVHAHQELHALNIVGDDP